MRRIVEWHVVRWHVVRWWGHGWVALVLRLYLGGVFLAACYHKILLPGAFAIDVATYQILPDDLINLTAVILPWVELFAGLMLVTGFRTRAAALLINGMMVVFIVALSIALLRGIDMGCGCFASDGGDHPISSATILRDVGWLAMGLYILFLDRAPLGLDRLLARRR